VAAVTAVLATLKRRNADEIDNKAALAIYVEDLRDLPIDAVERSCAEFRRGTIGDGIFAPTSAQIRQEALKVADRIERYRAPSDALRIPDERQMRDIRDEAHRIAGDRGLGIFEAKAEWIKFVAKFRSIGPTKLRWPEEWAKHCDAVDRKVPQPHEVVDGD